MSRMQRVEISVREGAGFDLEAVVPIAAAGAFQTIPDDRQMTRLPLPQYVTVLM